MSNLKSFDELLEGIPDIEGILNTLECYETRGVIDYSEFTQVIDRNTLNSEELSTAFTYMQRGLKRQIEKEKNLEDGLAYLQAMNYIAGKWMEKANDVNPMPESGKDNPNFTYLNSELFLAHINKDPQHLNNALFEFTEYVRDVKPELLNDTNRTFQATDDLEIIEGLTNEN